MSTDTKDNNNDRNLGYEDCRPRVRRVKTFDPTLGRRRSTLIHVAGIAEEADKAAMTDQSANDGKSRRRRNGRRGSVTHVRAIVIAEYPKEERHEKARRRRSFSGLLALARDASVAGSSSRQKSDDSVTIEGPPARLETTKESSNTKSSRKGRRRSSMFHVNTSKSSSSRDDETEGSGSGRARIFLVNPFRNITSSSSTTPTSKKPTRSSSNKNNNKHMKDNRQSYGSNKEKSPEQVLQEMEELFKVIQQNPEKRKILHEHLQKQNPSGFVRAA